MHRPRLARVRAFPYTHPVDPVTHTLAGVALGEAFLRPRWGRRAVVVSAWAANLPDIDAVVLLSFDPGAIVLRRSFGHSLLLLPLWVLAAAWLFRKKYADIAYRDLLFMVGLSALVHLFFDLINSFGVQLLWPLSLSRSELAITFIIDLALTGLLAAPHLARLSPAWRPQLAWAARAGLLAAGVYLLASFQLRRMALRIARDLAPHADWVYAFPEPFGPHRWRAVAREGPLWRVYLVRPLAGTAKPKGTVLSRLEDPAVEAARRTPFAQRLETFFKAPVWEVEESSDSRVVRARDLRFASVILSRRTHFDYVFTTTPDGRAASRDARIW